MMIPRLLRLRGSRGMYFYFNLIAWFLLIRSSAAAAHSPVHFQILFWGMAVSGFSSANSTVIAE